ncbi:protein EXECUTER, partial [Trifolium pratense]
SQLRHAVYVEDYEEAARVKVAIAAASNNDSVGKVISLLKRAIKEERYGDAALLRDNAGAGL